MTDSLAVGSALIAAAGLGFSGWQIRLIHTDRKQERDLEIRGVAFPGGLHRLRTRPT